MCDLLALESQEKKRKVSIKADINISITHIGYEDKDSQRKKVNLLDLLSCFLQSGYT